MTGGRRAPAVAHERAEQQDLGLDAFAFAGALHSLTRAAVWSGWGGVGELLSIHLTTFGTFLDLTFTFYSFTPQSFGCWGVWSIMQLLKEAETSEKGLSGCWGHRSHSMAGMNGGGSSLQHPIHSGRHTHTHNTTKNKLNKIE